MRQARGLTALLVLDALRVEPATRPELCLKLNLSKGAIHGNVQRLLTQRFIEARGRRRNGMSGLFATVWGISRRLKDAA